MSIANKDKTECCGCNACSEICPVHCISMREDKSGFLYPAVDLNTCIECGACERVCPFPSKDIDLNYPVIAYAAWAKNEEIHRKSSSGGVAYIISQYTLNRGGIVYGCFADGVNVSHIRIDNVDDISKLQGSKYVQSDVSGIFNQVKADLTTGRDIVFIGTPCQVAGLKKFLKIIPENLLLVDLICHGTPSQQMLHDHLKRVAPKRNIDHISFRDGNTFYILALEEKEEVRRSDVWAEPLKDMYYRAFMDGISYRPSCNECCFARAERVSDITIGDFWGIKNIESLPDGYKLGISVMLPATIKGKTIIESLRPELEITERSVAEAVAGNDQLRHPVKKTLRCRLFRFMYPVIPFDLSVKLSVYDKFVKSSIHRILRPLRPVLKPVIDVIRR